MLAGVGVGDDWICPDPGNDLFQLHGIAKKNTEKEAYLVISSKGKIGCSHQRARGWE